MTPARKHVEIHTDGACLGNPGPGGWGAILRFKGPDGDREKELSGGEPATTNNRMELMGVISGLEALKRPPTQAPECQGSPERVGPRMRELADGPVVGCGRLTGFPR